MKIPLEYFPKSIQIKYFKIHALLWDVDFNDNFNQKWNE